MSSPFNVSPNEWSSVSHKDVAKDTKDAMWFPPTFVSAGNLQGQCAAALLLDGTSRLLTGSDANTSPGSSGMSQSTLEALSSREYAIRASDPNDFASVWESKLVPILYMLMTKHCKDDFAIDVHNFPERSVEAVPRAIYVSSAEHIDPTMRQEIESALVKEIPANFNPIYLRLRRGCVTKSVWWGTEKGEKDALCDPKNTTYHELPIIGMSIGPIAARDAASLGGFIDIGLQRFALSAFHAFDSCRISGDMRVSHPAGPDLEINRFQDSRANSYTIGAVAMYSERLRQSLTFQGMNLPSDRTIVGLDWCTIGPVPRGKNVVPVPTFAAAHGVAAGKEARVCGNTEVYCIARTSGYSLGFTSDVPGLQKIGGNLRREWTVRQYAPASSPADRGSSDRWQTLKEWVTSGMGVPGDSGAWLLRRADNAVMGLIWGRNHDSGCPVQRARFTYFTPIVDILADIQQNHTTGEKVSIPTCPAEEMRQDAGATREWRAAVELQADEGPWSVYSAASVGQIRNAQGRVIQPDLVGGIVLQHVLLENCQADSSLAAQGMASAQSTEHLEATHATSTGNQSVPENDCSIAGSVSTWKSRHKLLLGMDPGRYNPSVPGLSRSTSVGSFSGSLAEVADGKSDKIAINDRADNLEAGLVRILDEDSIDEDVVEVVKPVRSKAAFGAAYSGLRRLPQVPMQHLLVH